MRVGDRVWCGVGVVMGKVRSVLCGSWCSWCGWVRGG